MTHPTFSRRTTLGLLLASASLATACGRGESASAETAGTTAMLAAGSAAPSLARAAVIHDALMLLASDVDVKGEWQEMLLPLPIGKPFEFSYAYGVASLDDDGQLVRDVIAEVRTGWEGRREAFMDIQRHKRGMMERRLSVAIGWAANQRGGPVLLEGGGSNAALTADGALLRALAGQVSRAEAERLLRLHYERTLIAMHTLEPDLDGLGGLDIAAMHEIKNPAQEDVNRFMDAYADWVESVDDQCARLAGAMASPSPAGYPDGAGFYDPADPIISTAENLRRGFGTPVPLGRWQADIGASRYARALAAAYSGARLVFEVARGDRDAAALDTAWPA